MVSGSKPLPQVQIPNQIKCQMSIRIKTKSLHHELPLLCSAERLFVQVLRAAPLSAPSTEEVCAETAAADAVRAVPAAEWRRCAELRCLLLGKKVESATTFKVAAPALGGVGLAFACDIHWHGRLPVNFQ